MTTDISCHAFVATIEVVFLILQLSEISDIEEENIEIAKGKGTFPGDISVLDAHTGLDWNANALHLTSWPLYLDSGSIVIYRSESIYRYSESIYSYSNIIKLHQQNSTLYTILILSKF